MSTLTVGSGGEFKTIADAVSASHDGDVINVQAGTYTNDFVTVNTKISIVGVGGMVKLVATVPPPNGKALILINSDLNISNFDISGGSDGGPYGNVAGMKLQAGNLTITNSYIHNNQMGLLATANLSGSVTIDRSEFAFNGSDGMTHNIYIDDVGKTVVTNSYIHDVLGGGTEFRSRGPETILLNNRFYDNSQSANYVLDLPSGGNVTIQNNVIQKSATATNPEIVHWGASVVVPFHANSSLNFSNNTIINNDTSSLTYAVYNQSNLNNATGQITVPTITNNQLYGVAANRITNMAATTSGNTVQSLGSAPSMDTSRPWTVPTTVWNPAAEPQDMLLTTMRHTVTGGAGKLTVTDTAGCNTITGGSGGMVATVSGLYSKVTTAIGAADTVSAAARTIVDSEGSDVVTLTGTCNAVTVGGSATVNAGTAGGNLLTVKGNAVVNTQGTDYVSVVGGAVTVTGSGLGASVTETGGSIDFTGAGGKVNQTVTVSGGAASVSGSSTATVVTTAATGASKITIGTGTDVVRSYGSDTISAGAGTATVYVSGSASVAGGTGALQVVGLGGVANVTGNSSQFIFSGVAGGLNFIGGSGTANIHAGTAAVSVTAGSGNVTLVGGSGNDMFKAGSGTNLVYDGSGTETVQFGTGNTTVVAGTGQDIFKCIAGQGGARDQILNFNVNNDKLDLGGNTIQSQSVIGSALNLKLSDGTTIVMSGITKLTSSMLVS